MKILSVSDIHGDKKLIEKISKLSDKENVDLIILAGDHTWFEKEFPGLIKPLAKKPILIIPGNHESPKLIEKWEREYENLTNIHKKGISIKGVGFFGSGTTDWGFEEESAQIFKELTQAHDKIKNLKKKVMITHVPPKGSKIELLGLPGSYGVRKALDQFKPDFLICGHMHEGAGLIEKINKTKVMNVARNPTIFKI